MTIYHKARGQCVKCGYPAGNHRPDCEQVAEQRHPEPPRTEPPAGGSGHAPG